jgi:hypothetical protein
MLASDWQSLVTNNDFCKEANYMELYSEFEELIDIKKFQYKIFDTDDEKENLFFRNAYKNTREAIRKAIITDTRSSVEEKINRSRGNNKKSDEKECKIDEMSQINSNLLSPILI